MAVIPPYCAPGHQPPRAAIDRGNWTPYRLDVGGDGDYTGSADLDQSRTHNVVNEIYNATAGAAITEGQGQTAWAEEHHDAPGAPALPLLGRSFPKASGASGGYAGQA